MPTKKRKETPTLGPSSLDPTTNSCPPLPSLREGEDCFNGCEGGMKRGSGGKWLCPKCGYIITCCD